MNDVSFLGTPHKIGVTPSGNFRAPFGNRSGIVQEPFRNYWGNRNPNNEHFEMKTSQSCDLDVHLYDEPSTSLRATKNWL